MRYSIKSASKRSSNLAMRTSYFLAEVMKAVKERPMKSCSSRLRQDLTKNQAASEKIKRGFGVVSCLVGVVLLTFSVSTQAFGQANTKPGANRSAAVNSRIGSTLKTAAGGQRTGTPERKPLLSRGNGQSSTSGSPTASSQPVVPGVQKQVASSQETCVLTSGHKVGSANVVEVSLEGSGDVLQTNQNGQYERAGIEFVAGFKYEERFEEYSPTGVVRTIREYEQAGMKRKFGSSITRPLLDSSRKNVVSIFDGKKTTVYSPNGPMKAEQYALLNEVPFNTTLLDRLLPNRQVKLGDSWQISTDVLAALLGVEAIQNNTVYLTLTSIVDNFAEIELYQQSGKDSKGADLPSTLECASEGASVGLDVNGKFQFDLNSKQITWFGLNISEHRSESVAAPGLECKVTLKITVAPLESPEKLTDDVVAKFKGQPTPEVLCLYYNAQKGPWKFRHSRRWKMIEDSNKVTALCYVDRGESVAQCNILSNGKIDLSTQPTLAGYKDEIKRGLGDRFAEFKQDAAYEGDDGISIYYVVADGAFEGVPFRWVYYLLTDKEGNQATIMFEIRADFLDRYDDSGNQIVESFRFAPKAASTNSAAKVKEAKSSTDPEEGKQQADKLESAPSPKKK